MTELLTRTFEEASQLHQEQLDEVAKRILADLAGELKWDGTLTGSQDALERLADEALEVFRAGRAHELGFDEP